MTTNITTFNFTPAPGLRTVLIKGEPWFIAADICKVLAHTNAAKAVADHVDAEDKQNVSLGLPGRAPLLVNESGLSPVWMRTSEILSVWQMESEPCLLSTFCASRNSHKPPCTT
ncbi:MAG: BRO family protein [Aquabacterium sp.]